MARPQQRRGISADGLGIRAESVISPLEGEMSPKATEGVVATGQGLLLQIKVGALRETTPSGLPAISPSRGEITHHITPPAAPGAGW
ncbi:MAG: hypothetical protein EOR48_29570 [Mesorhizobium sp.]|nr:MAG: hypothetical protein EOR48_29570 [Mesorhizobium sp.]TIP45681.1 MAG: hypothetical protein E5X62_12040 [Mesorhizobium sp.]